MRSCLHLPHLAARWIYLILGIVLWVGIGGRAGQVHARARVEAISFASRSDGQGYVIRLHASEPVRAYSMPQQVQPNQLEWTLFNTDLADVFRRVSPEGPVQRYVTEHRNGHLVLRFYLKPAYHVRATAYRDRRSDDLLLGLTYVGSRPPASDVVAGRESEVPVKQVAAASSPSTTTGNSTEETKTSRSARDRWRLDTVVIDAGHGGKDPGTHGFGIQEKDVVLDVAKILGGYLEEKLGLNVVYTRTKDRFVELRERGHIANQAGGKLFISIHANASRSRAARGTETYFLGLHKSKAAKKVMERENKVVNLEDNPEHYEELDEDALVRYELTQSAYMRQSQELAALVEEQFATRVHRKSRGVKQAGFLVLWGASMPAVLVELGFLSNRREARFLNSERGQVYMASAIFRAVRAYKEQYEKGLNIARSE